MKDPNLDLLEKVLRSKGRAASLGELRRSAGLDSVAVLRLVQQYPDKFQASDDNPESVIAVVHGG